MTGITFQLKNVRRDKMCILTFLLPILAGLAVNLLSGINLSSVSETGFAAVKDSLTSDAVHWLRSMGRLEMYENRQSMETAVNQPASQLIGVIQNGDSLTAVLSGDELEVNTVIGNTLPKMYEERAALSSYEIDIVPGGSSDSLKPLLTAITMATALFMGCTFNAMNMINEKEEGIGFVNEVMPMTKMGYMLQKLSLGYIGAVLSAALTAFICIRISPDMIIPLLLVILLSAFLAALAGLFIGHFSDGLMSGIVCIKMVMILFLAPPVLFYLVIPEDSFLHTITYLLPSSAAFYGILDLINGYGGHIQEYILVLLLHSIIWLAAYLLMCRQRKS